MSEPALRRVAVAVIERDGRFLIARRHEEGPHGGLWELPGGKCRKGEGPAECVVREVREETGLTVSPGPAAGILRHRYERFTAEIHVYFCRILEGEARPLTSQEIAWIGWDEIGRYRFPEANQALFSQARALRSWHLREGAISG